MRVMVRLKITDMISGEERIIADGPAILNDSVLLYKETGGFRHRVSFRNDLVIERSADVHTTTILKDNENGEAVIESPYGTMTLRTECLYKRRNENVWTAEYKLYSGNENVLYQKLVWTIHPLC